MTWNSSLTITRTGDYNDHGMSALHLERPSEPSYTVRSYLESGHELRHLDLSNRNLRDVQIPHGSSAYGSSFARSCMWRVKMQGINFGNADFRGADLSGADFMGSQFEEANFLDAMIDTSTILSRTYLVNSNGIYRLPVADERGYEPYAIWHTKTSNYGVGWLIFAGCRVLNYSNAIAHWLPDYANTSEKERCARYTYALHWLNDQPIPDLGPINPPEEVTPIAAE